MRYVYIDQDSTILAMWTVIRILYPGGIANMVTLWADLWIQYISGLACANIDPVLRSTTYVMALSSISILIGMKSGEYAEARSPR
ncbi:hypothetical protein BCON_0056g00170 [Botryotinia convoluta]|uniref:Uncharacterized protein n=1 Tax=Botryotinia convoluta TaxID=54673 RepID=A0A4Z1IAN3_9HELO|nr:hypothetical protein BCON_0056g00170 [Botryotinia convoluta]